MRWIFSLRGLIAVGNGIGILLGLYILLLILPFFEPVWAIVTTVLVPFVIAVIFAYLLNPLIRVFMKFKLSRTWAILFLFVFFFGGLTLFIWYTFPVIMGQIKEFLQELPQVEAELSAWFKEMDGHLDQLPQGLHDAIDDIIHNLEQNVRQMIEGIVFSLLDLFGSIFLFLVVPFLVFYLLYDAELIYKLLYYLIPRRKRKVIFQLWRDIDYSLGQYIRGQITVSFCVGVLTAIGYYLIDLPYALFLATIVAITDIIPYFGPIIGTAPAVIAALLTEPSLILWLLGVSVTVQMIESNVLSPYIVGKKLHIHPIFIIFTLLVGAEIGGVIGLVLAVPAFVILKVIILNVVLYIRRFKTDQNTDIKPE